MIKNEREYRVTKGWVKKFRQALEELEHGSEDIDRMEPLRRQLHRDGLTRQLEELEEQVTEYEALKSGRKKVLAIDSIAALPEALIKARIAAGLTQKDLARQLGLKEQQIQRYEATDYESASLSRLLEIADAIGVKVRDKITLRLP